MGRGVIITEPALPPELVRQFDRYPENKRRPVNKILFKNEYFHLTYSMRAGSMAISSRGDIVYSAIPYDTCRNYIQRAAVQYLVNPESVHQFIEMHKSALEMYLIASIYQVSGKKVDKNSPEVMQAYQAIFEQPFFEIQILGRLLQHNETGPLSANLAGKFLFSENAKTGISEYVSEYINFVVQLTNLLPLTTDGRNIQLLETKQQMRALTDKNVNNSLTSASDIKPALESLNKPILRSKYGKELSDARKDYVAHSVPPEELEQYFENVLPTENTNMINVVSDIHTIDGELPFSNDNFNILAGDISDSHAMSEGIRGIYVIGNHELTDVLPDIQNKEDEQWKKWMQFYKEEWFERLVTDPDDAWYMLPVGDHYFYELVKMELEKRFPRVSLLHNSSIIHEGIRYVGLTIPVALVERKNEQQKFMLESLKRLLNDDYDIPTIIVSHAPLFNELSMLPPKSKTYNREYFCAERELERLFAEYNIIGTIHGHHHIPASSGRNKTVKFAGKEMFVVCSIYSKVNTGFELTRLINAD